MDKFQKQEAERLEKMYQKIIPSQIPVNATVESYQRMLSHTKVHNGIWFCSKTGAEIKGRMIYRNVFDRHTGRCIAQKIPVVEMYCASCDKVPITSSDTGVYSDQLQTLSM